MSDLSSSEHEPLAAITPFAGEVGERVARFGFDMLQSLGLRGVDAATEALRQTPQAKELKETFGVDVRSANGAYEYYYGAGGQEHIALRTPANAQGLEGAQAQLKRITDERIQQMETQYGVTFAKPGTRGLVAQDRNADCSISQKNYTHARLPKLPELFAMDYALQRSQPSQLTEDGTGVHIYFLDGSILTNATDGRPALGMYVPGYQSQPSAFYVSAEGAKLPPTGADPGVEKRRNLAWVTMHELTHNGQDVHWPNGSIPEDLARDIGWQDWRIKQAGRELVHWLLKGNRGDLYGHRVVAQGCDGPSWSRLNAEKQLLNEAGNPVERKDAPTFTGEQVQRRALVPPFTRYFINPKEEVSEAVTAYRYGASTRGELLRLSPALYAAAVRVDDNELASVYGVNEAGKPKLLRLPTGLLAERNEHNENRVHWFEINNRRSGR